MVYTKSSSIEMVKGAVFFAQHIYAVSFERVNIKVLVVQFQLYAITRWQKRILQLKDKQQ